MSKLEKKYLRAVRDLAEARHSLLTFKSSRTFRAWYYARNLLLNPKWAIKNIGTLPSILKKRPVPPLSIATEQATHNININEFSALLRYPNISVACLGSTHKFRSVTQVFDLAEVDINDLLIETIGFFVLESSFLGVDGTSKLIANFKQAGVPIVIFLNGNDDPKGKKFTVADCLVSPKEQAGAVTERLFVEIDKFNPHGWQRISKKEPVVIGKLDELHLPTISDRDLDYEKLKSCLYVVVASSSFRSDREFDDTLLKLGSSGIPVIVYGSKHSDSQTIKVPFMRAKNLAELSKLTAKIQDTVPREKYSIQVRRYIHLNWSQINYFEWILAILDIKPNPPEKISIILSTNRPQNLKVALENVRSQNYSNKELVLLLHGDNFNIQVVNNLIKSCDFSVRILHRDASTVFGNNLSLALDECTGTYVTKMDDDDFYGPNHLLDLLAAYRYSGAEIVGKWSNWVYLTQEKLTFSWSDKHEEIYAGHLPGATIFTELSLLKNLRFGNVKRAIDSELYQRLRARGGQLYSTHRYNFTRVRHDDHTYQKDAKKFIYESFGEKYQGFNKDITLI